MKTKIVEHIAGEARKALGDVELEVLNMRDRYPNVFASTSQAGLGLDMAVLRENLKKAQDLVDLLL